MDSSIPGMVPIPEISHTTYPSRRHSANDNNNIDIEYDPSENSTLEGSALSGSAFSVSMSHRSSAVGATAERDYSRHSSMGLSAATTISTLSDDYQHRTPVSSRGGRRPLASATSTDDDDEESPLSSDRQQRVNSLVEKRQRRQRQLTFASQRRRSSSNPRRPPQATDSIQETEDEHQNDSTQTQTTPNPNSLGDDSGAGMTHIAPPSPTPRPTRSKRGSVRSTGSGSSGSGRNGGSGSGRSKSGSGDDLESHLRNKNQAALNSSSGHQSIVSASAKKMALKNTRRKQSKQQPRRISAYQQLEIQRQQQLQLEQEQQQLEESFPSIIVPAGGTRLSSSTNNNSYSRRQQQYDNDDNYSLANSTIATRETYEYDAIGNSATDRYRNEEEEEDNQRPYFDYHIDENTIDEDDESIMSPIPPSSAATWKRTMKTKLPNKLPQRKGSMKVARLSAVTDGCSVVTEDDDDETVLSPLKVTLPKEKVHEALQLNNLNLNLPLAASSNHEHRKMSPPPQHQRRASSSNHEHGKKSPPPQQQQQRRGRQLLMQKAKSVSHLIGLEEQLKALPQKDDDSDDDDIVDQLQQLPDLEYVTAHSRNSRQPSQYSSNSRMPTRRMSIQSAVSRNTRSLSPVRNRWNTGIRSDAALETMEDSCLNLSFNFNNHSNVTALVSNTRAWQLAEAAEPMDTTLVFSRAQQQTQQRLKQQAEKGLLVPKVLQDAKGLQDVKGLGAAPRYSRDNASLASSSLPETTSLAKSHSTPNLNPMDESTTNNDESTNDIGNSDNGAQKKEKMAAEQLDSLLKFLLGEGIPIPPESVSSSANSPKTKSVANVESTKETMGEAANECGCAHKPLATATDPSEKEQTPMTLDEKSIHLLEEQKKPDAPKEIRVEPRDNYYKEPQEEKPKVPQVNHHAASDTTEEQQQRQDDQSKLPATDTATNTATEENQQEPAMPPILDLEPCDENEKNKEEKSKSFLKKITKQVKSVGQASTRYLTRKKGHSLLKSAEKDEMFRLSQSMSSIVTEASTASLSESGWHTPMEKLEEHPGNEHDPDPKAPSTDAKTEGKEPADEQDVAQDVDARVNDTLSNIPENPPGDSSAARDDVVWERPNKSVTDRRKSRSTKEALRSFHSSFRHEGNFMDESPPLSAGPQRLGVEPKSAVNSSASPKISTRIKRPQRPRRASTVNENHRNRSSSGSRDKSLQRSKSSSGPRHKEKSRSAKKTRTRFSVADESLRSLFENESHDSEDEATEATPRPSKREGGPRMSVRRHMHSSLRNFDDVSQRSSSTRKSLMSASAVTRPSDRRLGMKTGSSRDVYERKSSSRDLYERKSKARSIDESAPSVSSSSRRGSKMKFARQAKSERFLNSSNNSDDEGDHTPSLRAKPIRRLNSTAGSMNEGDNTPSSRAKPIRRLGSRAKSGSHGLSSSSKRQLSSRRLSVDKDNDTPSTAGARATVSSARQKRMERSQSLRHMEKSQSLRHMDGAA